MKKIAVFSMVLLLMGMVAAASANSLFTLVDNIDDFNTENIRYSGTKAVIENFENDKINNTNFSIAETNGAGTYTLGYYENIVDVDSNRYQVVSYAGGMHGFGAWFDLVNPGGVGTSMEVYADNNLVGVIDGNTAAGQFWGFYSKNPALVFSAVTLKDANLDGRTQETYQMVDMAACPAPIPGSLLLLGSGMLGLAGIGIRRKSS